MHSIFRIIIVFFVTLLLIAHLIVLSFFFYPVPKMLNLAMGYHVEYVALSNIPEHVIQAFLQENYSVRLLSDDKYSVRKITTKLLNVRMNKFFDEDERLELYLNTLNFGGDIIGIELASNYYFKKSVSDLSFEESLTLAGLYKVFRQ